jgi:hypothetical protein
MRGAIRFAIALDRERLSTRTHGDVEAVLRYVDTNGDDVHVDPSLPNRASHVAAQATVRVRWNNGRGAKLTHGLQRPRGYRAPAHHRDTYVTRVAAMRVTRGNGLTRDYDPSPALARLRPHSGTLSHKGRGKRASGIAPIQNAARKLILV